MPGTKPTAAYVLSAIIVILMIVESERRVMNGLRGDGGSQNE